MSAHIPQRRILVDVCGTLYHENTTFAFLDSLLGASRLWRTWNSIRRLFFARAINRLASLFGLDPVRWVSVMFLRGYSRHTLRGHAAAFVSKLTPIDEVQKFLAAEAGGKGAVLVTATIDPVAEAIAAKLEVSVLLCSELAYQDQVCSGRLAVDALFSKAQMLEEKIGLNELACSAFITDNRSDIDVLRRVANPIIVTNRKGLAWWQRRRIVGATFMVIS